MPILLLLTRRTWTLLALLAGVGAAWFFFAKPAPRFEPVELADVSGSPMIEYVKLTNEFSSADGDAASQVGEASPDERAERLRDRQDLALSFATRMMALAEAHPDEMAAVMASSWAVQHCPESEPGRAAAQALAEDWVESEQLLSLCEQLAATEPVSVEPLNSETVTSLLKTIKERSPHQLVQALARLALVRQLQYRIDRAKADPAGSPADAEAHAQEAIALLDEVIEKYGDLRIGREATLGERAKSLRLELGELRVGEPAPEIEG